MAHTAPIEHQTGATLRRCSGGYIVCFGVMGDRLKRRTLIGILAGETLVWPGAAQQTDIRRLGVLIGLPRTDSTPQFDALLRGLRDLGWNENRNLTVYARWGDGDAERMRSYADELTALKPDAIVVQAATALREMQRATKTIPLVFISVSDPVRNRFVDSLARPGGNTTGFTLFEYEMASRWLQLLKDVAPRTRRVLALQHARNPNWPGWQRVIETTAPALGVAFVKAEIATSADIEAALESLAREPDGGLLVLPDPFLGPRRRLILDHVARHRLPAVYAVESFSQDGGLVSYSVDQADLAYRAATYVSRIFKGEHPSTLPVQTPTKFKLTLNSRTASALGIVMSSTMLARADVIID